MIPSDACAGCGLEPPEGKSGSSASGPAGSGGPAREAGPPGPPPDGGEEPSGSSCPAGFERPSRRPFLIGVYLATNAIPDVATIVDGPDCAFFKAEFIHGKHDLNSTLLDVTGKHRIVVSHVTTDDVAKSRGERVAALMRTAGETADVNVVLITSLPMVSIIGIQYDQIIRDLQPELDAELVEVPGRSLQGDWMDGYADTLEALAGRLEARDASPSTDSVSIMGYLMDRNEEDHRSNVRELRRLVEAVGLKLDSVWLSGEPWSELGRATGSGTLLALPLGRPAAARLAATTGAKVVHVDVPFGLSHTTSFLRALGEATGRAEQAEEVIRRELEQVTPRLEWAIPHLFLGRRVVFFAPPDLLGGFHDLATEIGMEVIELSSPAKQPKWFDADALEGVGLSFDVSLETAHRRWWESPQRRPELVIGNTELVKNLPLEIAAIEFGYPSYVDHAFFDRPYLGFRGYVAFVQRMATELSMNAARRRR